VSGGRWCGCEGGAGALRLDDERKATAHDAVPVAAPQGGLHARHALCAGHARKEASVRSACVGCARRGERTVRHALHKADIEANLVLQRRWWRVSGCAHNEAEGFK